jgi:hypothetical protein
MSIYPTKILLVTGAVFTAILPIIAAQRWFTPPETEGR